MPPLYQRCKGRIMRILYLGLSPREETYRRVKAGELPTDRLYGIVELQRLGYDVCFKCLRPRGLLSSIIGYINSRFGFNLPGLGTLSAIRDHDVIVVNGPLSTLITLACRALGRKIVYLDTVLRLPKNILRKLIYKINLKLCDGTIMYSESQMHQCEKTFNVSADRFKLIPFAIDYSFYKRFDVKSNPQKTFILSVGRDQARDYATLVKAMKGLDVNLKLVTLPYLLRGVELESDRTEILENVSYEELYKMYSEALFVVIPLKKWGTTYSSGTRAMLEAKTLGKTVIASRSLPLEEYMGPKEGVFYVEPENVEELRKNILMLLENRDECTKYGTIGKETVNRSFTMDIFATAFGDYLSDMYSNSRPA
jgi:glycosyltransferase involved in cell wall biosynthesis